jgi:hypothetical protein
MALFPCGGERECNTAAVSFSRCAPLSAFLHRTEYKKDVASAVMDVVGCGASAAGGSTALAEHLLSVLAQRDRLSRRNVPAVVT